jgi:hypothetical protein
MVQKHLGPVSQTSFSEILSAPTPHKILESLCFFSVRQLQGFFDEYFLVKSHLREVPSYLLGHILLF